MIFWDYLVKKADLHILRHKKCTNKCFAVAKKDLCLRLREEHTSHLSLKWFMALIYGLLKTTWRTG